ncbi:hypothetical protein ABBQ38_002097 [Trebouxia sp. C0009 RCD-2024]
MSQQQLQQKAGQAKEKSQAFSMTVYNSSVEVFDAATSVIYYLVGAAYGISSALISVIYDPKVQGEVKEAVNGVKADVTDGAYDIKARVADSTGPAMNDAKAKASDTSKQAQGTASDLSKQGQAKANYVTKQAQGTASDFSKQGQNKANDVKNQAVSAGKQAQGQLKQTAQANGVKA